MLVSAGGSSGGRGLVSASGIVSPPSPSPPPAMRHSPRPRLPPPPSAESRASPPPRSPAPRHSPRSRAGRYRAASGAGGGRRPHGILPGLGRRLPAAAALRWRSPVAARHPDAAKGTPGRPAGGVGLRIAGQRRQACPARHQAVGPPGGRAGWAGPTDRRPSEADLSHRGRRHLPR